MNEKLKKILDALYRNSNDFQQACEKELCDPRIPDSSNFVSFLANKRTAEKNQYFELIDNNFQQTTSGEMDEEAKAEINELAANISAASVSIPSKDYAKPKVAKILEKESKNLDKTTQKELLANFNAIAAENENSFSTPIIATFLVTLAKSKKLAKPEMTKEINKYYSIASKLILASAPKHKLNNIQDAVLDQIKESFGIDSKEYTETQRLLNNAVIRRQLSSTATDGTAPCHTNNDHGRILRYYQNGSKKLLIINNNPVEPKTSIEDAIKTFDLNDNSNFLKYALDEIDKKVREVFNKNNISDKCIIPATETIFLTLCHQLGKEVDDNVLFAISDPLSDMLSYSLFNEEILTAIKDICKEISGKEVEFGKEVEKPAEDKKTEVDDKKTESDASTQPTDNEQEIKEAVKKLKKSFFKLDNLKTLKSIQPALSSIKKDIVSAHYTFVGSPVFGKKTKRLSYVTPAEQNLMGNLNIGQGKEEAKNVLDNTMKALKIIYETQLRQIQTSRNDLIKRVKAGEVVSKDEIDSLNKAIEGYNKSTDPKILLKAFSRMFKLGLQKESLVSEQYLDQFKEDHPELF